MISQDFKLAYFSHTNIGPSETFVLDLVKAFGADPRVNIQYISGQPSKSDPDFLSDLDVVYAGYSQRSVGWGLWLRRFGALFGVRGHKWRLRTQQRSACRQVSKALSTSVPEVAFIDYATTAVWIRPWLEKSAVPYVVHVHGFDVSSATSDSAYCIELEKIFSSAQKIVCASNHIRRLVVLLGCPESKTSVIRLGVDNTKASPIPWRERLQGDPSVVFLGRLTEKKNPIALIHAFAIVRKSVPNAKLTIIGDGPLKEKLSKRIKALGLQSAVTLFGVLDQAAAWNEMRKHWIYAQHSVTALSGGQEGFALSLAEAAAHELPVVSTWHNGIPENVIHGETGYLVQEFDYEEMAVRIVELMMNPELMKTMGEAGRQNITQNFEKGRRYSEIKKVVRAQVPRFNQ